MDKMLITQCDDNILITNDGATILDHIDTEDAVTRLMIDMVQTQQRLVGDGTTGAVILAGALLEQGNLLLDQGLHPLIITRGYDMAYNLVVQHLREISEQIQWNTESRYVQLLKHAAKTALNSNIANRHLDKIAEICVEAVLAIANLEQKEIDLEWINIDTRVGGTIQDIELIHGITLHNTFSHPQMPKEKKDAKICIMECIIPPKPKFRCFPIIRTVEDFKRMEEYDKKVFQEDLLKRIQATGANTIFCQSGCEDEYNDFLRQQGFHIVRWCYDNTERIAVATGASYTSNYHLSEAKIGSAKVIREVQCGTTNDRMLVLEGCANTKAITILITGGNRMVVEEMKRSVRNALCSLRNLIRDSFIVYGGGSAEISCSLDLQDQIISGRESLAIKAFAEALKSIPATLAENCGWKKEQMVAELMARQYLDHNACLGMTTDDTGIGDMKSMGVFEALASKIQQMRLATDIARMVLRVDYFIRGVDPGKKTPSPSCTL